MAIGKDRNRSVVYGVEFDLAQARREVRQLQNLLSDSLSPQGINSFFDLAQARRETQQVGQILNSNGNFDGVGSIFDLDSILGEAETVESLIDALSDEARTFKGVRSVFNLNSIADEAETVERLLNAFDDAQKDVRKVDSVFNLSAIFDEAQTVENLMRSLPDEFNAIYGQQTDIFRRQANERIEAAQREAQRQIDEIERVSRARMATRRGDVGQAASPTTTAGNRTATNPASIAPRFGSGSTVDVGVSVVNLDELIRLRNELQELKNHIHLIDVDVNADRGLTVLERLSHGFNTLQSAADIARNIFDVSSAIAQLNVDTRRTSNAFQILSGNASNAEARFQAVVRASENNIDTMRAMQLANQSDLLGLAKTAEELERVIDLGNVISKTMPDITLPDTVEFFSRSAANQTTELLDQMGISGAKVRAEIQRLKELYPDMSKEQLMFNAIINEGEKAFDKIGDSVKNVTSGYEQFTTALQNANQGLAQSAAGGFLNTAFSEMAGEINRITFSIVGDLGNVENAIGALERKMGGIEDGAALTGLDFDLTIYEDMIDLLRLASDEFANGSASAGEYKEELSDLAQTLHNWETLSDEQLQRMAELSDALTATSAVTSQYSDSIEIVTNAINNNSTAYNEYVKALEDGSAALVINTAEMTKSQTASEMLSRQIVENAHRHRELIEELSTLKAAFAAGEISSSSYERSLQSLSSQLIDATKEVERLSNAQANLKSPEELAKIDERFNQRGNRFERQSNLSREQKQAEQMAVDEVRQQRLMDERAERLRQEAEAQRDLERQQKKAQRDIERSQKQAQREYERSQQQMLNDAKRATSQAQKEFEREQDRIQNELKQAELDVINDVGNAWQQAADEAANAWKEKASAVLDAVSGVSSVTGEDFEATELGQYSDKVDEFLRRAKDELINGVDWAEVDIADIASRLKIDPTLPAEQIYAELERQWESLELFADAGNLELINQEALQAIEQAKDAIAAGERNILEFAGLGAEFDIDANAADLQARTKEILDTSKADHAKATAHIKQVADNIGATSAALAEVDTVNAVGDIATYAAELMQRTAAGEAELESSALAMLGRVQTSVTETISSISTALSSPSFVTGDGSGVGDAGNIQTAFDIDVLPLVDTSEIQAALSLTTYTITVDVALAEFDSATGGLSTLFGSPELVLTPVVGDVPAIDPKVLDLIAELPELPDLDPKTLDVVATLQDELPDLDSKTLPVVAKLIEDVPDLDAKMLDVLINLEELPELDSKTLQVLVDVAELPDFEPKTLSVLAQVDELPDLDAKTLQVLVDVEALPAFDAQSVDVLLNLEELPDLDAKTVEVVAKVAELPEFEAKTLTVLAELSELPELDQKTLQVVAELAEELPDFDVKTLSVIAEMDALPDLEPQVLQVSPEVEALPALDSMTVDVVATMEDLPDLDAKTLEVVAELTELPDFDPKVLTVLAQVDDLPDLDSKTLEVLVDVAELPEFEPKTLTVLAQMDDLPDLDAKTLEVVAELKNEIPELEAKTLQVLTDIEELPALDAVTVEVVGDLAELPSFDAQTVDVLANVADLPEFKAKTLSVLADLPTLPEFDPKTLTVLAQMDALPDLDPATLQVVYDMGIVPAIEPQPLLLLPQFDQMALAMLEMPENDANQFMIDVEPRFNFVMSPDEIDQMNSITNTAIQSGITNQIELSAGNSGSFASPFLDKMDDDFESKDAQKTLAAIGQIAPQSIEDAYKAFQFSGIGQYTVDEVKREFNDDAVTGQLLSVGELVLLIVREGYLKAMSENDFVAPLANYIAAEAATIVNAGINEAVAEP